MLRWGNKLVVIVQDLDTLTDGARDIDLEVNPNNCEMLVLNASAEEEATINRFQWVVPGIGGVPQLSNEARLQDQSSHCNGR